MDLEQHPVGDTIQQIKEYKHSLVGGKTINNIIPTYAFVWTKHTSPDATSASGTLVLGNEVCDILTKNVSNLVIQQYALQRIGQETEHKELYEKIVTRSLYGNINASRNSA